MVETGMVAATTALASMALYGTNFVSEAAFLMAVTIAVVAITPRRGGSAARGPLKGLVLGALIWPLVFAAQLTAIPMLAADVCHLFWLSGMCAIAVTRFEARDPQTHSAVASAAAAAAKAGKAHSFLPSRAWVVDAMVLAVPLAARLSITSSDALGRSIAWFGTAAVLSGVRGYLAQPPLNRSFSSGERSAVAVLLTLLFVNTGLGVVIAFLERGLEWPLLNHTLRFRFGGSLASIPFSVEATVLPVLRGALPVPSRAPLLVVCGLVSCAVFVFGACLEDALHLVRRTSKVAHKLESTLLRTATAQTSTTAAHASTSQGVSILSALQQPAAAPASAAANLSAVRVAAEVAPSDRSAGLRVVCRGDVQQAYVRAVLVIGVLIAPVMAVVMGDNPFAWLWKFFHWSRGSTRTAPFLLSASFFEAAAAHTRTVAAGTASAGVVGWVESIAATLYGLLAATPIRILFCEYFVVVLFVGVAICAPAGHPRKQRSAAAEVEAAAADAGAPANGVFKPRSAELSPRSPSADDTETDTESEAESVRSRNGNHLHGRKPHSVTAIASITRTAVTAPSVVAASPVIRGADGSVSVAAVRELPSLSAVVKTVPTILLRKYYHGLVLVLFVPAVIAEPAFCCLAMCGAFTIFLVCEFIRISALPPMARPIRSFMQRYLDERDSGVLVLTHMYLLVGCALPVLLHSAVYLSAIEPLTTAARAYASAATARRWAQWFPAADSLFVAHWLPALSGVLALGVGDTAASAFGYMFGRRRWPLPRGSRKTLVGTAAATLSVLLSAALLTCLSAPGAVWSPFSSEWRGISDTLSRLTAGDAAFVVGTVLACLFEAFTEQIDNLFLPLYYYAALALCQTLTAFALTALATSGTAGIASAATASSLHAQF